MSRAATRAVYGSTPGKGGKHSQTHSLATSILALSLLALGLVGLQQTWPAQRLGEALEQSAAPSSGSAETERQAREAYGKLPLSFIPNAGQNDPMVRYSAQAPGFGVHFTPTEAMLALTKENQGIAIGLRFLGASPKVEPQGGRLLSGTANYLIGNDPAKWRTGLPTYGEVVYRDLWPGIDMAFRGADGQLKYEFLLQPGASVEAVRLAYRGTEKLSLGRDGSMGLHTALGVLTDAAPVSYQMIEGRRVAVESRYVLGPGGAYGFAVGGIQRDYPLVIDPGVAYSTYLGGSNLDAGLGITVDVTGSAYVTGRAFSIDFPTSPGAFDTSHNGGNNDAFVTKLDPTGSNLLFSTYLGGAGDDTGAAITVDPSGSAYVTGRTQSGNFPTTPGAFDTTFAPVSDAFVTKLAPTGAALTFSTYLGGSSSDRGNGIAVDASGSPYVTGETNSGNFPTTPGAFDSTFGPCCDAFVTKLAPTGSTLGYSTYLGGSSSFDFGLGIAVDGSGSAYVTGWFLISSFGNFPTTPGAFDTTPNGPPGNHDAFVTKLASTGSTLVFSTYLGGTGQDQGFGIALDGSGSPYVTGLTASTNLPTTPGAYDTSYNAGGDAFVTKFVPTGSSLAYSTYLGGSNFEQTFGIALDGTGGANVTGYTTSADFPTTAGAFDTSHNGGVADAFVTKMDPTGGSLSYSTFLGGAFDDRGFAIAADGSGSAYVTGATTSFDFPTTPGAFQPANAGGNDAFVTKLDMGAAPPATLTLSPPTDTNPVGTSHTVTATVEDSLGNPVPGVTVRFSVTGANNDGGSDVTDANGEATFTYTGTVAGTDAITAFADTNNDGDQDPDEPFGAATKVWTPGAPATLTLAPPADTNTVGTTHCVTATVRDAFGNPVPGVTVRFSVPTAVATHASPSTGSDVTDANGEATFCYTASLPGVDAIHAFADTNNDGDQDPGEPFGDATKTWTPPPSTEFCEVKVTEGGWIIANNGDQASFGGNAKVLADGSVQGQENYQDHGPAQPRHVQSIELTAVTCSDDLKFATIFGTATIDGGGMFVFRVDVSDQGEPGTNDSYGIILSDGYVSGQHQLQGGNVEIHRS